jgi:hypothetical protein
MKSLLIVLLVAASGSIAHGYANFIGYGYQSCGTCHYNSFGSGPLNDYGRALWASEIAGRVFHSSAVDEETLANQSGFLGSMKLPDFWRPSIGSRAMYLTSNLGGDKSTSRVIVMQADFTNVLKFGAREDLAFVFTFGYVPKPFQASASTDPKITNTWISREHYARYNISKKLRIFAGMMDKVYGLRVPDHIAYSRQQTGLAQNDQSHGVALHYNSDKFEAGINGFVGNLAQDANLRQQGISALTEFELAEKFRLGGSVLASSNEFLGLGLAAIHARIGAGKGSSIMAELGAINRKPLNKSQATGAYGFVQNLIRTGRGFHFLTTFEYYTEEIQNLKTRQLRFTPGFMYFPAQRIEVRIEAANSRYYDPDSVQKDRWDIMSQLHLWF